MNLLMQRIQDPNVEINDKTELKDQMMEHVFIQTKAYESRCDVFCRMGLFDDAIPELEKAKQMLT
jgi:hypothetical protein